MNSDDRLNNPCLVYLQSEQLIDEHGQTSSLDRDMIDRTGHDIRGGCLVGRLTDQDVCAISVVQPFEPVRHIHRIADDRVIEAGVAADIADDDFTGVQADSCPEGQLAGCLPALVEYPECPLAA